MNKILDNNIFNTLLLDLEKLLVIFNNEKSYDKRTKILEELLNINNIITLFEKKNNDRLEGINKNPEYYKIKSRLVNLDNDLLENRIGMYRKNSNCIEKMEYNYKNLLDRESIKLPDFQLEKCKFSDLTEILLNTLELNDLKKYVSKQINNNSIIFINSRKKLSQENLNGEYFNLKSLSKEYFIMEKCEHLTYYNIFCLIHELLHGYLRNKYNTDFYYNVIREVIPILTELIYEDKLDVLGLNKETNIHKYYFITDLSKIIDNFENIKDKSIKRKHTDNKLMVYNYFRYMISYIIALYLHNEYIFDKEKTIYNIDLFIKNSLTTNLFELLEYINLSKVDICNTDDIKRFVKEYNNRLS